VVDSPGPDLDGRRHIHIIGVGGSGMSAIATVLLAMGHRVSGSDAADSATLRHLAETGVAVHAGHAAPLVEGADVVVRSTAIPDANVEVVAARAAGVTVWRRADVLAAICRRRPTVAVSGTHGKTTTSSMLAVTLDRLGWHPSMIIGGDIAGIGPGARWDDGGDWFVVEADESDGTFVELGATAAMVTSVEADHLEFYGGLAGLEQAFERFVDEPSGPVVVCADDPGSARLARRAPSGDGRRMLTYGTSAGADLVISEVRLERFSSTFTVCHADGRSGGVSLAVPGLHNVRNAAGVIAMAGALGAAWPDVLPALAEYRGVGRRFEWNGEAGGVAFVDGYDHLPTEVAAALATAQAGRWSRVVAVFQPHRYSRTESLWSDFADSFTGADVTVITGIYPAGEAPRPGVSGTLVFDAVRRAHPEAEVHYAADLDEAAALVLGLLHPGDLCLTLGAGDITLLGPRLQDALRSRSPS
jgi:UDP-N-acetylmuramate--alanine ligase